MNYAEIKQYDVANGPGVRVSLFVSGCTHHCKECFNPETWDFKYGKPFTEETIQTILSYMEPEYVKGDRKSTRLNSSHRLESRMPSSA